MKVVPFPKAVPLQKGSVIIQKSEPGTEMFLNGFSFTCPTCSNKTNFNSKNMIFKEVEFFCNNCGTKYNVVNPAFSKRS